MEMNGENRERQPPLLLISHGEQYSKQSFYSVLENRFRTTNIPELCNKKVLASTYGWLVLVDTDTDECCLWNPISMEMIELPELEHSSTFNRCVLSKPPTDPDCHVLFNSVSTVCQSFCQIGDHEFATRSSEGDDMCLLLAIGSFQGKIYGFTDVDHQFVTIHFVGKTLELSPILKEEGGQPWCILRPSRPWVQWHDNFLIESSCGGELWLVHKMYARRHLNDGLDFRVFRVDTSRMECMELETIGERAIFLSHQGSGFCCSAVGIKPNSIYYTVRGSRNLYIYDLDDRSTTLLLPCPAARRCQSVTCWVEHQVFPELLNNFSRHI